MIVRFYTYITSLLSKANRRFADGFRDARTVVDEINIVRKIVPEWAHRIRHLDQEQLTQAQALLDAVRAEMRELAKEMAVTEGKLHEASYIGETLVNRLATGEHLTMDENLKLLVEGDAEGLAMYMNWTVQPTVKRTLGKVTQEQKMMLLEVLLEDVNKKE